MATEPTIPLTEGDMPDDPVKTGEEAQENGSNTDKSGEQDGEKGGKPGITEEQYNKLVEGWREDREELNAEIAELKRDARSSKLSKEDEAELEGLDEDERVEKLIEIRERKQKAIEKAELRKMTSEIRFYERTSTEFAENKSAILKVAKDYECNSLKQAILVWRGLEKDKKAADAAHHDKRKKGADGKPGGQGGAGKTEIKPYDKKVDGNKSFGQMFREGGVQ